MGIEHFIDAERELEKRQAEREPDAFSKDRLAQIDREEQDLVKERARRQAIIAEILEEDEKLRMARKQEENERLAEIAKMREEDEIKERESRKHEAAGLAREVTPELLEARDKRKAELTARMESTFDKARQIISVYEAKLFKEQKTEKAMRAQDQREKEGAEQWNRKMQLLAQLSAEAKASA